MQLTASSIAELVNGTVIGEGSIAITNLQGLHEAQAGDLSFLRNAKYAESMQTTQASAVLVTRDYTDTHSFPIIQVDSPDMAFAMMLSHFEKERLIHPTGIHPTATQGDNVTLGDNITLDAHVHLADNVTLGNNVILYAGVYIGRNSTIGDNTVIYPNTTIRENCTLGKRCIIHSNCAIGTDGFGFAPLGGQMVKIPQIGTVVIGNDVEIGSNTAIDRATCGITTIKDGVKIDNLVQIAHNVSVGEHTTISGQTAIAGSAIVGKNVTLAGRSGIVGHITVGDNVTVGASSIVVQSCGDNEVLSGFPAIEHKTSLRAMMATRRLPHALRTIRNLEKRLKELEDKIDHG